MNRLIAAAALTSALLVTGAEAQSVTEDVNKQLWCGIALTIFFAQPAPDATAEDIAQAQAIVEGGNQLIAAAIQAHLDAGFTQDAADKIKADLVPVVTQQISGDGTSAQYTGKECFELVEALLQPPTPDEPATSSQPMSEQPSTSESSSSAM